MKTSTTRRLQLSRGFSAVVFCSIAATHLATAQNAPAGAAGPNNAAPPITSPNEDTVAPFSTKPAVEHSFYAVEHEATM